MTSPRLLAEWSHDPGCSCSRTSLGCCLRIAGTLWPVSFRDWPRSAMSSRTGLYELPMLEPLTSGSGGSASPGLLPTPTAREKGGANCRHGDPGRGDDLPEAVKYLPTPNASDGKGASQPEGRERSGRSRKPGDADLPEAVALLRTPTAQLAVNGGSQHPDKRKAGGHGPTLADEVEHLLPTPNATHERKTSRTGPLLHGIEMLLPTPRATDGTKGGPNQRGSSGDLMLPSAVMELLPTPMTADGERASTVFPRRNPTLAGALLPTPSGGRPRRSPDTGGGSLIRTAARRSGEDAATNPGRARFGEHAGEPPAEETGTLAGDKPAGDCGLRADTDWGPYEPAIRRWEAVLGRPAPRPTEPGRTGERLSPRFVEFLMGLPEGWVTDVPGLSRNAQLKALGNGCVPQQAVLALRLLLDRAGFAVAEEGGAA